MFQKSRDVRQRPPSAGPSRLHALRAIWGSDADDRYRSVVQSALDAIITINGDNQITEFNPAAETIFGFARAEVLGRDLADLIIPEELRQGHREGLARHRDSADAPRIGRRIELEALRSDGSRIPIELTVTREPGLKGSQFTAFIRDLSQQRNAEKRASLLAAELKASEHFLAGVLSNLPGMAFQCVLDGEPQFSFVSDGAFDLCGYTPSDLLSRRVDWADLVHDDDRPRLSALRRGAGFQDGRYECTYRLRSRDGTAKWVKEQGTLLGATGGKADLIGVVIDVTAETLAREQLDLLNSQLEERVRSRTAELAIANEELETFSYSIAHDLRAPLTSIAGFARIIEEKIGPSPELARFFARIRSGIQHMDDLTRAILSLAQVKRSSVKTDDVDLAEQAREVVARLMEAEPRETRIEIPAHLWVRGDTVLLRQVMENLLRNAWKFSSRKPVTFIRLDCTQVDGATCTVTIEDRGAGFDAASAERLFKPFERLHLKTEFEGTGIGLAVVHRIVAHHGGTVWATARPGEGASFHFTLPAGREPLA